MKFSIPLFFLFFVTACSMDLKNTIINVDTVSNQYLKVYNYSDHTASLDVLSFIIDTGDMQGVILYGGTNLNDIQNIANNDINSYFPDLSKKPGYLSIQSPSTLNYNLENKQLTSFSRVSIASATTSPFYFSSSVLFKNPIYAAIHNNEGFFENAPADILTIFPKNARTFTAITNFANAPATGSVGYDVGSADVVLSGAGGVQFRIESTAVNSKTMYSPVFVSSTSTVQIVSGGYLSAADADLYHDMSQRVYANKSSVSVNNVYLIKDGNNYFKIYVRSFSTDPKNLSSISDPFSATISVYYSDIPNANKF